MRLIFLGVRGSTAAPGAEFVRYGGHTSCVAVVPDGEALPTLVLDAGTGLRNLSGRLGGQPYIGSILLSHLHWDHVQGLPFFVAGDRDDAIVDVYLPAQDGQSGLELLARSMSPPSFPITPEGLGGRWTFEAREPGTWSIGGLRVTAAEIGHKGGRTYGYRIDEGGRSFAYLPEHKLSTGVSAATRNLVSGVDVLVHNAQFLEPERGMAQAYGHSTVPEVVDFAVAAGVGRLVLFHHGPARTDDAIDALVQEIKAPIPVSAAAENDEISLG